MKNESQEAIKRKKIDEIYYELKIHLAHMKEYMSKDESEINIEEDELEDMCNFVDKTINNLKSRRTLYNFSVEELEEMCNKLIEYNIKLDQYKKRKNIKNSKKNYIDEFYSKLDTHITNMRKCVCEIIDDQDKGTAHYTEIQKNELKDIVNFLNKFADKLRSKKKLSDFNEKELEEMYNEFREHTIKLKKYNKRYNPWI